MPDTDPWRMAGDDPDAPWNRSPVEELTDGFESGILTDSQIARVARRGLDDSLRSLAPHAAPPPFMVAGGAHGVKHVELHALSDPDFAETARTVVPAFIVLDGAAEVALAAFTTDPARCGGSPECALIAWWGPGGREFFTASVTRRVSQPPVLGEWLRGPTSAGLGPIDEGVRSGLDIVDRLREPDADPLRERIDSIRSAASTSDTDVLPSTLDALREWGWLD